MSLADLIYFVVGTRSAALPKGLEIWMSLRRSRAGSTKVLCRCGEREASMVIDREDMDRFATGDHSRIRMRLDCLLDVVEAWPNG